MWADNNNKIADWHYTEQSDWLFAASLSQSVTQCHLRRDRMFHVTDTETNSQVVSRNRKL